MNFSVLGPIGVEDAGAPLKLDGPRIKALLAYLLLHANRPVPTTELLDALWGEQQPRSGATAVQNAVLRLRRSLGDRVVTAGSGYLVRVEDGELDLAEFRRLRREAQDAPSAERAHLLAAALALWQGAALGGIDAAAFAAREAAALEDERLAAMADRVDAELALGRHAELVPSLSTIVAEHPLDERFRAQLIVALYRSGRQAAALDVYRETRRLLMDELGLEPSPALRDLERAVLTQDPSLDPPPAHPRAEETPPAVAAAVPPADAPARDRPLRRGLVVVAVTAALGIAGASLAVALTRHEQSAAGTATTIFQVSQVTTTRATTRPRAAVKHVVKKKGKAQPVPAVSQPRVTTVVVAPTVAVTTTAPVAATTASTTTHVPRTTPATTAPATTTRPTTSPAVTTGPKQSLEATKVYWIADDFAAPAIDSDRWHLASHGAGVTASRQDGSLELSVGSDATMDPAYGVDTHYGTQCLLTGDFDATVDYRLLQWPDNDGMLLGFGLYHPPPDESYFAIERRGGTATGASESYGASGGGFVRTSDGSGSLRLRRRGSRLTMYYRRDEQWVALGTVTAAGPSQLILTFAGNDPGFGRQPASVAFDDFVAQADTVSCPGLPLPFRKARA